MQQRSSHLYRTLVFLVLLLLQRQEGALEVGQVFSPNSSDSSNSFVTNKMIWNKIFSLSNLTFEPNPAMIIKLKDGIDGVLKDQESLTSGFWNPSILRISESMRRNISDTISQRAAYFVVSRTGLHDSQCTDLGLDKVDPKSTYKYAPTYITVYSKDLRILESSPIILSEHLLRNRNIAVNGRPNTGDPRLIVMRNRLWWMAWGGLYGKMNHRETNAIVELRIFAYKGRTRFLAVGQPFYFKPYQRNQNWLQNKKGKVFIMHDFFPLRVTRFSDYVGRSELRRPYEISEVFSNAKPMKMSIVKSNPEYPLNLHLNGVKMIPWNYGYIDNEGIVAYGEGYLGIAHHHHPKGVIPAVRWGSIYTHFFYVLSAYNPWTVVQLSRPFCFQSVEIGCTTANGSKCEVGCDTVQFISGMEYDVDDANTLLISYGTFDCTGHIFAINLQRIAALLNVNKRAKQSVVDEYEVPRACSDAIKYSSEPVPLSVSKRQQCSSNHDGLRMKNTSNRERPRSDIKKFWGKRKSQIGFQV